MSERSLFEAGDKRPRRDGLEWVVPPCGRTAIPRRGVLPMPRIPAEAIRAKIPQSDQRDRLSEQYPQRVHPSCDRLTAKRRHHLLLQNKHNHFLRLHLLLPVYAFLYQSFLSIPSQEALVHIYPYGLLLLDQQNQ